MNLAARCVLFAVLGVRWVGLPVRRTTCSALSAWVGECPHQIIKETMKKAADDLLQAVHETDIDSLQQKLAAAEAASVAPELLEQGRRRLSQLLEQLKAEQKRKEAEEALQAAMAAEIIGPLEMAVARAEAADVNHEARVKLAMLMRYGLLVAV